MARNTAAPKKKVFIVEDHPVFAAGLASLLNQEPSLVVCGTAETLASARVGMAKLKPDLLVLDLSLPDGNGFDIIGETVMKSPQTAILVLSMADEMIHARRVLQAGARGYLMKHEPPARLLQAALQVLAGRTCVSNLLQSEILRTMQGSGKFTDPVDTLTERERQVLRLIGDGRTAAEIARQLGISAKTVDTYRVFLKRKLGVRDSHALVCRAIQLRIQETHQ